MLLPGARLAKILLQSGKDAINPIGQRIGFVGSGSLSMPKSPSVSAGNSEFSSFFRLAVLS